MSQKLAKSIVLNEKYDKKGVLIRFFLTAKQKLIHFLQLHHLRLPQIERNYSLRFPFIVNTISMHEIRRECTVHLLIRYTHGSIGRSVWNSNNRSNEWQQKFHVRWISRDPWNKANYHQVYLPRITSLFPSFCKRSRNIQLSNYSDTEETSVHWLVTVIFLFDVSIGKIMK